MNQQYRVQIATQDLKFVDTTRLERMNSSAATSWPIRWECKTWHSAPCGDTVWKNDAASGLIQYSFTVAGPCLYETRAESRNISLLKLSNKTEILYPKTIYHQMMIQRLCSCSSAHRIWLGTALILGYLVVLAPKRMDENEPTGEDDWNEEEDLEGPQRNNRRFVDPQRKADELDTEEDLFMFNNAEELAEFISENGLYLRDRKMVR